MYVERRPVNELPEGARILSEDEVVEYYNNYTFGTTHSKEIWHLKYGFSVMGGSAFITNFYLVDYYRRRCNIRRFFPIIIMNLCFVAVPSTFALVYHYHECRRRILLQDLCLNCLYGRAAIGQNLFSILYPIGPSALGCMAYACTQQTYPIPGFESWSVMKDTFKVYQKFTKRIIPILCVFIVVQTVISTHITRQELEDKYRLDNILKEQRDKLKAVAAHYQEKK